MYEPPWRNCTEDWMSTPSPGSVPSSAPPLSPSPGSQNHSYNMSNGYASPMSAGSYDPYSPTGKTEGALTLRPYNVCDLNDFWR
ncbi:GM16479 [Drosophila sechellia]|uniref:GM16479 n=1 Tax=Drosophila sechellia TaxID=7238 RepID=B4II40_DROSE|nr:GM16479 [Drosophila sechellia]